MTALYLPKTCGKYVNFVYRIEPEVGFLKKRDSENHVALLALQKLHKNGYLDEYLFPKIGPWSSENQKANRMYPNKNIVQQANQKSIKGLQVGSKGSGHMMQNA